MATPNDQTTFRTITEDGELHDEHGTISNGFTVADFTDYTATQDTPGTTAQWYVVGGEGDILAEANEFFGLITYPAADIFA